VELFTFTLFGLLAVASALVVVTHRNPVYATMSLVVTLVAIAVLFVLLGAPFLAALQILIYTGAIVVLFLFVIMLLNLRPEGAPDAAATDADADAADPDGVAAAADRGAQRWVVLAVAALFGGLIVTLFWRAYGAAVQSPLTAEQVSLRALSRELFTTYMLPFQIVGLLLLAAVIAATVLARRAEPSRS
jgi:NADH-quinone oxidoreductase subunit J